MGRGRARRRGAGPSPAGPVGTAGRRGGAGPGAPVRGWSVGSPEELTGAGAGRAGADRALRPGIGAPDRARRPRAAHRTKRPGIGKRTPRPTARVRAGRGSPAAAHRTRQPGIGKRAPRPTVRPRRRDFASRTCVCVNHPCANPSRMTRTLVQYADPRPRREPALPRRRAGHHPSAQPLSSASWNGMAGVSAGGAAGVVARSGVAHSFHMPAWRIVGIPTIWARCCLDEQG
ncbi:Uncharacterised protein [Actinomyces slackii]|uniref:Uncharacterized protein n=1 Tax=Actinomyces slackii TaxID=52774 RepID=A0A448KA45_9ACTO|nr:Uncharacterised protein [Actinomyces slackii]